MTIRQHLVRRGNRTARNTVIFLLVAGFLVTEGPQAFVLRFVFAVLMGAVVLAALWSLLESPCPHCRKRLGRVGFCVASGMMVKRAVQCPSCRADLDAELPS